MPLELHLATNMDELNRLASSGALLRAYKRAGPSMLYKITKTMYQEVIQNMEDNEQTYVYAYRFLKLLEIIYKKDTDQRFVSVQFDSMRKQVGEIFTELQNSLPKRYELLANKVTKGERLPESPEEIKVEQPVNIFAESEAPFISPRQLYTALQKASNEMLIIDIRPTDFYNTSKLNGNYNIININSTLVERGVSASKLEEKLSGKAKELFNKRDQFPYVLLADNDTVKQSFHASKLKILYDMLTIWDLNKNYEHAPYVLDGGYVDFVEMYPTLSTNPHVTRTQRYADLDDLLNLDSIDYPALSERFEVSSVSKTAEQKKPEDDIEKIYKNLLWHSEKVKKIEEQMFHTDSKLLRLMTLQGQTDVDVNDREQLEYERKAIDLERTVTNELQSELKLEFLSVLNNLNLNESEYLNRPELLQVEKGIANMSRRRRKLMDEIRKLEAEIEAKNQKLIKPAHVEVIDVDETVDPKQLIFGDSGEKMPPVNVVREPILPEISKKIPPKINRANKPLKPVSMDTGLNGLINIRNTCYMNSIIQCMRHIPFVRYFFISGEYKSYVTVMKPKIIHLFGDLLQKLWIGNKRAVRPQEFYNKLVELNPVFGKGHHEDANEFFMIVFNHINEDIDEKVEVDRCWPQQRDSFYRMIQKKSILIEQFYYQIRNDSTCRYCQQQAYSFSMESMIILNPPLEGCAKLKDMIDDALYTCEKGELYCRKCERMSGVKRTISYQPRIVTILLKRYYADMDGKIRKMNTPCIFPLDKLTVGYAKYKLWGICLHSGTVDAGHYTAVCLNVLDNKWYEFNDATVRAVDLNMTALEQQVYMLFYQITDEKAVGFI